MKLLKNDVYFFKRYRYDYIPQIYIHVEDLVEEGYYATAMLADILFPFKFRI